MMKTEAKKFHNIVRDIRDLLTRFFALLSKMGSDDKESELISDAITQLEDLFLLVVAGEYNSGKSAFINALLGGDYLKTGITPTTDKIHILDYASERSDEVIKPGIQRLYLPVTILEDTRIVDTPGTNAILREHEILTKEYIPRSDLVIFITSIDRPFTESERAFLEQIKEWGKKIIFIINKIDLVSDQEDIRTVIQFVSDNAFKLLNHHPQIFTISAKQALADVKSGKSNQDLEKIESYIFTTLNQHERMRIKLSTPLNILEPLKEKYKKLNTTTKDNFFQDRQLIEDINDQLALFSEDSFRRFKFRYADIDNALLEFQKRGIEFFDDTFRIARLLDLANNERMQREYKDRVVKDLSSDIDKKINDLTEWLVDENYSQWQTVNKKISDRMNALKSRIVLDAESRSLQGERKKLIEDVKRESQRIIEQFDRNIEAKQIANDAQMSVATSAAIEAGAIGLGALVTILATTASADLTGILLAGITATLGFFIIPTKRNQAKFSFNRKIDQLREQLSASLSKEITRQLDIVVESIQSTLAPYERFVHSELTKINDIDKEISELETSVSSIRNSVDNI